MIFLLGILKYFKFDRELISSKKVEQHEMPLSLLQGAAQKKS
jgi:hypothetical protein